MSERNACRVAGRSVVVEWERMGRMASETAPSFPPEACRVLPRRVIAFVIDFVAWIAAVGLLTVLLPSTVASGGAAAGLTWSAGDGVAHLVTDGWIVGLFFLVGGSLWWIVVPARWGSSIGKWSTGIRVVRADGSTRIGMAAAFVRQVLWVVDGITVFIPVGLIAALTDPARRRVGDRVAHTYVVRSRAANAMVR